MFDPNIYMFQGISLMAMVFGLVEFIKDMANLSGKVVTILSAGLGALIMLLYQLAEILPDPYSAVFKIAYLSIAFGLSASGYYKFLSARVPKQD